MSSNLLSFILGTLQPRLNDANNAKYWLPELLMKLKGRDDKPLLPLKVGDIEPQIKSNAKFIAQTIAHGWGISNMTCAIPDPAAPSPRLRLSDLVVHGLDNVYLKRTTSTPVTAMGYDGGAVLQFNRYEHRDTLSISGSFDLKQDVCSVDCPPPGKPAPTQCNGETHTTKTLVGTFTSTIDLDSVLADFTLTVAGEGESRSLTITVNRLKPGAPPRVEFPKGGIKVHKPEPQWVATAVAEALRYSTALKSLSAAVAAALENKTYLDDCSSLLTGALDGAFDDVFASVPPPGLPKEDGGQRAATPVDLYVFDRMRVALGNPLSSWYLPWRVALFANPVIEPYVIAEMSISDQNLKGLDYTDIKLTGITIEGASNADAPLTNFTLDSPTIKIGLLLGCLPAGPNKSFERGKQRITANIPAAPPMVLSGHFTFTQSGIQSLTCSGEVIIKITKASAEITAEITAQPSSTDTASLVITVKRLAIDLSRAEVSTVVKLSNGESFMEQLAEALLSNKSVIERIGDILNQRIAKDIDRLSKEITEIARKAIDRQLA